VEAQRPIDSSARVRLAPAATRMLGADLFVNVGGATAPVKRLMGSGPELWWGFSQGLTIAEVAAQHQARTGVPYADVEARVQRFASELVDANLAELTW
jgi:hypothetical protein